MKGDPDAAGGVEFNSLDTDRGRQCSQCAFGHLQALRMLGYRLQYDDEFIATETRDGVDSADDAAEPLCNFLEQFIARTMAHGVIDGFESIQIQEHQCERLATAVGKRYRLADPVLE